MATVRGNFAQLLAPGINEIIFNDLTRHPEEYSQTFNVSSSTRAYEEDVLMAGLGAVPLMPEGAAVVMDDPIQGGSYRYTHQAYGLGFQVTEQMYEDDQYGKIKTVANDFSRSIKQTVENTSANILTNAFTATTGTLTIDGVTLYNTAHPLLGGGTYSNRAATDISLSTTGMQEINNLFERMVDERGLLVQSMPKQLLIPPELQYVAGEILNSSYKPNSGNNEVNVWQGRLEPYINHYLTLKTAWFVLADKGEHKLKFFWRKQPKFDSQDDYFTNGANFKVSFRFSVGATYWHGTAASKGA